jgi:hypothetical protein
VCGTAALRCARFIRKEQMPNIIFVKHGEKYTAAHVNKIYNQLLTYYPSAKYYCYTDDPAGIQEHIHIINILDRPTVRGVWNKLALFAPDMSMHSYPLNGRCIFFDLDMDVKHDPSQFLNANPGLTLCSDYWKRDNPRYQIKHAYNVTVNSSIMAWVAGEHVDIWQKFLTNTDYYMRKYKGIDRFIIHENFTVNTFKDGIVSSVANPYSGGAAIDMYNGIEYVV